MTPTTAFTGIIIHHFTYVKVEYKKPSGDLGKVRFPSDCPQFLSTKKEIFFLYFEIQYVCVCNEIEYAMLEEYLAKIKQKDTKEKEPKKEIIVVA